jgi:hypothetical protein
VGKKIDTSTVRQFVRVTDRRIGVVIANESAGGVYRGHCDMWFGRFHEDGTPIVEQLLVTKEWETIEAPLGEFPSES